MSMHKSLKSRSLLVRQRSVLSRWERIEKLRDAGRWKDGDPVLGLPKVRTKFKVRSRKVATPAGAEGAAAAGAAAPAAGAPAAKGAAPAAGAKPAAAGAKPAAAAAGAKPAAAPAKEAKPAKK
jgi:small basic protein (TIGR04137 family)